jgi:heat shock protein HslJ
MIEHRDRGLQHRAGGPQKAVWRRRSYVLAFAGIAAIQLASAGANGQTGMPAGLESPDQGVVCNRQRAICYDRNGPSIGLTEGFLGKIAADRLTKALHGSGNSDSRGTTFSLADGVECVRETGPCLFQRQRQAMLTAVVYGPMSRPAGQTAEMRAIMYGEWDWQGTRSSSNIEVRPDRPERYTLRFEQDGALTAKVDCNTAGGKYRFERSKIMIELTNSTLMSCEPGSLEQTYQQNLAAATGYFMKEGQLFLELRTDVGTMEFDRPALHATSPNDAR